MNGKEEEYQGWHNYETWVVALWIDNEQCLQEEIFDIGRACSDPAAFADMIKEFIDELAPDLEASMFSDLLNSALGEVDWFELARTYREVIAEIDEQTGE